MLFFNGKEEMDVEASLKLLDLSPDASIDDANQAYTYLHQMIDLFHKDTGGQEKGSREEDMGLLTGAYEKALAFIGERTETGGAIAPAADSDAADVHLTINFPDPAGDAPPGDMSTGACASGRQAVDEAICITQRRRQEAEASLPNAQKALETAESTVRASAHKLAQARQARMNAMLAAKSAHSKATLMEIEAKRTMQEAMEVAQKARDRVVTARKSAGQAKQKAQAASKEAERVLQSEQTAAAEMVCAEDQLEQEKARVKALTHTLVETRNQMRMFGEARSSMGGGSEIAALDQAQETERDQLLSDLMAIESSLVFRQQAGGASPASRPAPRRTEQGQERRQHPRIVYSDTQRPTLQIGGHTVAIRDLSATGMRLEPDAAVAGLRFVRGAVVLNSGSTVNVTGKVIRSDGHGLGVRLVTRIGNHLLDQERLRLCA